MFNLYKLAIKTGKKLKYPVQIISKIMIVLSDILECSERKELL